MLFLKIFMKLLWFVRLTKTFFFNSLKMLWGFVVCLFLDIVCENIQFVYSDLYAKVKDATSNLQPIQNQVSKATSYCL